MKRLLKQIIGWLLVLAGLAVAPTPIPIGLAMMAVGFYLLAQDSESIRNAIRWCRRHLPPLSRALNKIKPKVPSSVQKFIEITDPAMLPATSGE